MIETCFPTSLVKEVKNIKQKMNKAKNAKNIYGCNSTKECYILINIYSKNCQKIWKKHFETKIVNISLCNNLNFILFLKGLA